MFEFLLLIISAALVNNLLLGQGLAADALHARDYTLFGPVVAALLALAAPSAWLLNYLLLQLQLPALFWLMWILTATVLSRLVPHLIQRLRRQELNDTWPLLCANAIAIASLSLQQTHFSQALALGIGGGAGVWLVLYLLNDLRARLQPLTVPRALQGLPMLLICAGLMSLAFMGFNGVAGL